MTAAQFNAALDAAGLRQADFVRLLGYLSGQPAKLVTINRWARGSRAIPLTVPALLTLWEELSKTKQRRIFSRVPPAPRPGRPPKSG